MKKINIAIIGSGGMGKMHLLNCLHNKNVNVMAVADTNKQILKKSQELGVKKTYSEYVELIEKEKDLDAVIISLPNFLHHHSVVTALENDLHVLVEKPLANTVEECEDILRVEQRSGNKVMVGYSMRFVDAMVTMKNRLEEGIIGELELATLESIQNGPLSHGKLPKPVSSWWFDPKLSGGGVLIDLGSHLIDLFHFFTGENSNLIFSKLDYNYNLPVEDGATLILETEKTAIRGIVNVGWFEKTIFPRFNFRTILHGTADYVSTDDLIPSSLHIHAVKSGMSNFFKRISGRKITPLSYTYWYASYYKELEHFVDCITLDEKPLTGVNEGKDTIEIIQKAYALNGRS